MSIAEILGGTATVITAVGSLITAVRAKSEAKAAKAEATEAKSEAKAADEKAGQAEQRAAASAAWADKLANAERDGVVILVTYPGTKKSARAALEINGWRVQPYVVSAEEVAAGQLLPGEHILSDVAVADAIVVEGLDEANVAKLAATRVFRDRIRAGAGVALHTAGNNYRYDLALWGDFDQGVTTPVTTEGAVRASLARRDACARSQGIRPGGLAAAREQLLAAQ